MPVSDQGIFRDRYTFIPRALIFATRGDKVLLIKGSPDKRIWPNLYNGIGGHVEPGETILEAAHREFREETGLELVAPRLAAVVTIDTQTNPGIEMHVFRGEAGSGEPSASAEGELVWVRESDLSTLPLVEDLPTLIPIVLGLLPISPPIFAQYTYDEDQKLVIRISG